MVFMQQLREHNTWSHFFYCSFSNWWESICIMRRSTCQAWLSWHMDCSPNTYIHLKGERERQGDGEHTHSTAGYLHFLTIYLRAWIDNRQLGASAVILHQSMASPWDTAALRGDPSLLQGQRFPNAFWGTSVSAFVQNHFTATWAWAFG